jgi:heptosyltransferase-2
MTIWVVQTAFLGDAVLSLPFLARLAETHPRARIEVIAAKAGEAVFKLALERGLADHASRVRVHVFDKRGRHRGPLGMLRLIRELRALGGRPDTVYCLQRSFRSGALALLSGATERIGFSTGAASFFYTRSVRREWNTGRSEVEKNLDLLRAEESGFAEGREIRPWDPNNAPSLLRGSGATPKSVPAYAVLSLGSPWATKRWPVENAAAFARQVVEAGHELVLSGDHAARPLSDELTRLVPSPSIRDLTGATDIPALVDLIAGARLLVSGDSAAVHIASDLGVPAIAVFGPTLPDFGFAPWRKGSLAMGVNGLYCRPCDIHGPAVCPEGHHRCLKEVSGESVARQSRRFL